MDWTSYIGNAAGALTVIAFLPQVIRVLRTHATQDLSLGTFATLVVDSALWLVYGVARADWPVVGTNSGLLFLNGVLMIAKLRHG
jgi:MtN3 and saliva related transmembrane protein